MSNLIKFLILAILLTLSLEAKERPNFILLMGDDHGWEETGYNHHPYVKTPYLDEMATGGLRLDNFYAMPSCSPTRGSVLTGRHPNRFGIFRPGYSLRPEEITVAHLLKQSGYNTSHFGKWHVGPVKKSSPTNPGAMGFEEWLSHDNFFELDPTFSRNGGEPKKFYGESSEIIVDEAIDYIKRQQNQDKPFFIVVWFGSPHEPYSAMSTDLALYKDLPQKYSNRTVSLTSNETGEKVKRPLRDVLIERYAEITAMDRSIGKLRNSLKTLGLKDNTLLWYCGDNGTPPSGLRESKFRALKGKVYEGGVRVPGVIEWPNGINASMSSDCSSITHDILPTLCSLAGVSFPNRPLDGIDISPIFKQQMNKRPQALHFWNFNSNLKDAKPYIDPKLQMGTTPLVKKSKGLFTRNFINYQYTKIHEKDYGGAKSIIDGEYKLVIDGEKNSGTELFNLNTDISESVDISKAHPEIVKELSAKLKTWQKNVLHSLKGEDYN